MSVEGKEVNEVHLLNSTLIKCLCRQLCMKIDSWFSYIYSWRWYWIWIASCILIISRAIRNASEKMQAGQGDQSQSLLSLCGISPAPMCSYTYEGVYVSSGGATEHPSISSADRLTQHHISGFSHCLSGPVHRASSKPQKLFPFPDILATRGGVFIKADRLCNYNCLHPEYSLL